MLKSWRNLHIERLDVRRIAATAKLQAIVSKTEQTHPGVTSVIWKCCSPLQIRLGFLGILSKGTVDLLVEMSIPVIDEVHILVCVKLAPPAVIAAIVLPAGRMQELQLMSNITMDMIWTALVMQVPLLQDCTCCSL